MALAVAPVVTQLGIVPPVVASSVDIYYGNTVALVRVASSVALSTLMMVPMMTLVTPPTVMFMAPVVAQRIAPAVTNSMVPAVTKPMARLVTLSGTPVVALKSHLVVESGAVRSVAAVFPVSLVERVGGTRCVHTRCVPRHVLMQKKSERCVGEKGCTIWGTRPSMWYDFLLV